MCIFYFLLPKLGQFFLNRDDGATKEFGIKIRRISRHSLENYRMFRMLRSGLLDYSLAGSHISCEMSE